MKNILVIRNGEIKLRLPNCTIRSNGTVWASNNKNPLCDAESAGMIREGRDSIAALMKTGKAEQIPADCIAKYGENESGLLVVDAEEYYAKQRQSAESAMTTAQRERREIDAMYAKAAHIANSDSEDNVWLPMSIRGKADAALNAWREKYPAEYRKEQASDLRAKADKEREMASGALTYDADGWISAEEQQKKHDEHLAKAAELEAKAAELEAK